MSDFWGKVFSSTFTGSMAGAGADVFAVWSYALAHGFGGVVELSPPAVAALIGMSRERVNGAIGYLCAPDSDSRSKELEGRRLERIEDSVNYRIVNYDKYNDRAKLEARRLVDREKKAKRREKARVPGQSPDVSPDNPGMSSRSLLSNLRSESSPDPDPDQTRARGPNGELPQSSRELREAQSFGAPALKYTWDPEWIPKKSHQARARELGLTDEEVFARLGDCRLKPYPRGFETEAKHFMRELGWAKAEKDKLEFAKQTAALRKTDEKPGAWRGKDKT